MRRWNAETWNMKDYDENLVVESAKLANVVVGTCMNGTGQSRELGKVILKSGGMELNQLQDQVYAYGSRIKQTDYEDRNIFVCLVMMLRRMEQKMQYIG